MALIMGVFSRSLFSRPLTAVMAAFAFSLVSITVSGKNENKNTAILSGLSNCTYKSAKNITCCSVDYTTVAEAHDLGLSFGKYKAYLEFSSLDSTVTPREIQNMSMREIRDRIELLSEETDNPSGKGNGEGHGNHQGHGKGFRKHGNR